MPMSTRRCLSEHGSAPLNGYEAPKSGILSARDDHLPATGCPPHERIELRHRKFRWIILNRCSAYLLSGSPALLAGKSGGSPDASMSITLRQIRYFVAVAEQGSVSATAQSISISQSTITETPQELEADLGFRLFERHARGVELTLKGQRPVFAPCTQDSRSTCGCAPRAQRQVAEGRPAGAGCHPLVAGYVLSDSDKQFQRRLP